MLSDPHSCSDSDTHCKAITKTFDRIAALCPAASCHANYGSAPKETDSVHPQGEGYGIAV